jgi:hypothetical protein
MRAVSHEYSRLASNFFARLPPQDPTAADLKQTEKVIDEREWLSFNFVDAGFGHLARR